MRDRHRTPTQQESRIGVKGDPTPDHEYGDEPEHPSNHISSSDSSRKKLKCEDCGMEKEVAVDDDREHSCMVMTFDPEKGEVPCGGEMKEVEE